MIDKYNGRGRLRVHALGSSLFHRLRELAAWRTFAPMTGDTIAGFMQFDVAAPAWAPATISGRPTSCRRWPR